MAITACILIFITVLRSAIVWTSDKDLTMLKEIAAEGLLTQKQKSRERGAGWIAVATRMANFFGHIEVTSRAIRDRFTILVRKHKFKLAKEERASGIGGEELTEVEALLEELISINEETEKRVEDEDGERKKTVEKEKKQAMEMRQRAMEKLAETKKRQGEAEEGKSKRRRSNETFDWLREKMTSDRELREEEMKQKREERENQRDDRAMLFKEMQLLHTGSTALLKQQMEEQRKQQEQQNNQMVVMPDGCDRRWW